MLSDTFFNSFFYPTPQYVVISDSEYKQYQQGRAKQEIAVLENRLNRYRTATQELEAEIEKLQTTFGLLEPASDTKQLELPLEEATK